MKRFVKLARHFLAAEDGPSAVEYAVMLALIVVVCVGSVTLMGTNSKQTYTSAGAAAKASAS
jgi:pilus assembly protein Flp/PilA